MEFIDGKVYNNLNKMLYTMKPKERATFNRTRNFINLLSIVSAMFKYDNLPESIDADYLERVLCSNGCAIIGKIDGELIAMRGGRTGKLNAYGLGDTAKATTDGGRDFVGKIGEDAAIIYNNNLHTPEIDLQYFTDIITEIEKSLDIAINNTRDTKIPIVHDDKTKQAIIDAVKAIRDGVPFAVVSRNILEEITGDGGNVDALELTNPENVKHIEYILKAYNDIISRFWLKYGHNLRNTEKMAQASVEEITGADSISQVYPEIMLKARRAGVESVNKIFGTNITVDFSEIWRKERTKYENDENSTDSVEAESE